jgi:transposase
LKAWPGAGGTSPPASEARCRRTHGGGSEALLEGRAGDAVIADKGYGADRVIDLIEHQGSEAVIPSRKHRCTKPRAFDAVPYRERHQIEFFNRLKQFRRVATRYEKTARNYLAMAQIGCLRVWIRFEGAAG